MPTSLPSGNGDREEATWELEVRAPNSAHSLLASGSDDQHTIVWDPLHHKKLLSMHTGHTANIFSVKVSKTPLGRTGLWTWLWACCAGIVCTVDPRLAAVPMV